MKRIGLDCATLATPPGADAVAEPGKLRVLVVTGGHAFEREAFFAVFDRFTDVAWREAQQPHANALWAPKERGAYDVVALYDMVQQITEEQKAHFLEMLNEGKGLVALHHALCSYQQWPEYAGLVGGKYLLSREKIAGREWDSSTYKHDVRFGVQIADAQHPITRGMNGFEIEDEVYGGFWVSPNARPLLKTDHPESGSVIGWTNQYGKARVATLVLGHGPTAYCRDEFRTLVHRAICWAAGRLE